MLKQKNGITLIALVITIIVLLILAAVSIATLTGENGILGKAGQAAEKQKKAQYFEEINLEIYDEQTERAVEEKEKPPFITSIKERIERKQWVNTVSMAKNTAEGIKEETTEEEANLLIVETQEKYEIIIDVNNDQLTATIRDYFEKIGKESRYVIKYDKNGGDGEDPEEQDVRKIFNIVLRENTYTRTNYEFVGWCENAEGTGDLYSQGSSYTPTKDTTLYAIWRKNVMTVTFDTNAETDTVTDIMEDLFVAENVDTKLPVSTLKRADYYFINWKDGDGQTYEDGATINIDEDMTLYAQWGIKIKSISVKDLTILKGNSAQLEVTKTPNGTGVEELTYNSSNVKVATVDENGRVTGIAGGTVTITVAGEISTKVKDTCTVTVKISEVEAADVAKEPSTYYGSTVTGYTAGTGVSKWRIFYADSSNIYLIADDYISYTDAPLDRSNVALTSHGTGGYMLSLDNVAKNYDGSTWVLGKTNGKDNSLAKTWLNKYLKKNPGSTNANIKAVAYMLDTTVWSKYVDSGFAVYAIGCPTLEMYCASYSDTHPGSNLECEADYSTNGYRVQWYGGGYRTEIAGLSKDGEYDSIYIKTDTTKASGRWLASPSAAGTTGIVCTDKWGSITNYAYNNMGAGFCPVVCLRPDVGLKRTSARVYAIQK